MLWVKEIFYDKIIAEAKILTGVYMWIDED